VNRLAGLLGLGVFVALAWAVSTDRRAIRWKTVAWGMGLQALFGLLILKTPPGQALFRALGDGFTRLIAFTDDGARFVWGWLYRNPAGARAPVFLIDLLMVVVFFSALMSLLYHLGLMQRIIAGVAWVMRRTMGTSGSETLSAAANIFVGQTEAPLVVKPYLDTMTRSELHAVMVGGFATIAGSVLGIYVSFGLDAGHLIAASVMSAPAALVAAKLFMPETEASVTAGEVKVKLERPGANAFDAVCVGATDGLKLALNVVAMLLAFVSILAMINWGLGKLLPGFTLQRVLGWLLAPLAWLLGVPARDCGTVGSLLGTRMVLTEFVAYFDLMKADVSARAYVICAYAFCGFANVPSIAVQIGGISALAPGRRADLARLGLRAMLAGTLASFFTACIAGALLSDEQVERDFRRNRARMATTEEERRRECDAFLTKYPASPYAPEFRAARGE
jgi:concentrative nucleoside transporter, CNT family